MKTKVKKEWYGRVKNMEELYNDVKSWISEIDFINDEIRFLEHLLSSNYIDFLGAGLKRKIDVLVKKIVDKKGIGDTLKREIKNHKKIMSGLIETNSVTNNKNYLETHKDLEREIYIYLKKYKKLKKSIFLMVEDIIRKKEQKQLL